MLAVKVEDLSKAYRLGEIGTGTLSRDLERWYAKIRGKEDPFLKVGEINDRTRKSNGEVVWSLKDLNFEIQQGDAIGIMGRNGAGKSTLLKILSRITSPTTGEIKIKGRVASLLEVGTGFHPELTGRENIYLNGTILGMRKKEIAKKLDEIIAFAGVERYVDTPVKRYSSGMYVRLAFAVAAHLESEILIVDEVLAVGDAEFQKKCIGKMGDVCKGEGRTVLFVSHNIGAIRSLCNNAILLENGELLNVGKVEKCINAYNRSGLVKKEISNNINGNLSHIIRFEKLLVNDREEDNLLSISDSIEIKIEGEAIFPMDNIIFIVALFINGVKLFTLRETDFGRRVDGKFYIRFNFKSHSLRPGIYDIALGAWHNGTDGWIWGTDLKSFQILETWGDGVYKEDEGLINGNILNK